MGPNTFNHFRSILEQDGTGCTTLIQDNTQPDTSLATKPKNAQTYSNGPLCLRENCGDSTLLQEELSHCLFAKVRQIKHAGKKKASLLSIKEGK